MKDNPKITIGMPVYNGEKYINEAISSLLAQTYQNWIMFISDNASTDSTSKICKKYARKDNRIKHVRQEKNIGAYENFRYVLEKADTEYFMWAAHDDIWEPEFISKVLTHIETNKKLSFAFCNIANIDSEKKIKKIYPSFAKFASDNHYFNINSYFIDPETNGKANLFYSIFRTSCLLETANEFQYWDCWGSDMLFILSYIVKYKFSVVEEILFKKRVSEIESIHFIEMQNHEHCIVSSTSELEYKKYLNSQKEILKNNTNCIVLIDSIISMKLKLYQTSIQNKILQLENANLKSEKKQLKKHPIFFIAKKTIKKFYKIFIFKK